MFSHLDATERELLTTGGENDNLVSTPEYASEYMAVQNATSASLQVIVHYHYKGCGKQASK
jgi:hypothetical protein